MSRNTKTVLIVIGALLALCVCGCLVLGVVSPMVASMFLSQSVASDPADVAAIGSKIADFETPPGYSSEFGMSFMGFDLVGLTPGEPGSAAVIFLMQIPGWANADQASMEQQLRQSIEQQFDNQEMQLETVDETTVTIRDQPVTMTIQEGTTAEGESVRQMTGVFQGKGGPVLLMILGDRENWNQATIDQFLASIR
jgi:hypothetical protein